MNCVLDGLFARWYSEASLPSTRSPHEPVLVVATAARERRALRWRQERAQRTALHELRRAKMRELVARDDLRWETELNAMGLTVSKERA